MESDAFLIIGRGAQTAWVQEQLAYLRGDELKKRSKPVLAKAVYVDPGATPFTHEALWLQGLRSRSARHGSIRKF